MGMYVYRVEMYKARLVTEVRARQGNPFSHSPPAAATVVVVVDDE